MAFTLRGIFLSDLSITVYSGSGRGSDSGTLASSPGSGCGGCKTSYFPAFLSYFFAPFLFAASSANLFASSSSLRFMIQLYSVSVTYLVVAILSSHSDGVFLLICLVSQDRANDL